MKSITLEVEAGQPLPTAPGKSCGGCTACCHTVPVKEIGVEAFHRCPHMLAPPDLKVGCSIYSERPRSCRLWSCGWLIGDLPDKYRPDRLGIVMDPLPDLCRIAGEEVTAAQFWLMPGHEDDWQKDDVKQLILQIVDRGMVVLWRMRDPDTGGQMARVFGKRDGAYFMTPISKSSAELSGYTEPERLLRAQNLMERRNA
jgi:hypothetical protein